MTRVLMTADAVGGVWTYAVELVAGLQAYDVEVHLAVIGPAPTPAQRAAADSAGAAGVHCCDAALEWMPDPWADVERAGEWLLDLERCLGPDVVHLNGYTHAASPWQAPVVVVAHSDVVSWWRAVHAESPPPSWSVYSERVRQGLAAADAVVAPTQAVLDDLARSFGHQRGQVIPNCRRADWVRAQPKEPLLLSAGRVWDEAKNLAALDDVAADLPWPVVIIGAGEGQPQPGRGATRLGRLEFAGLAAWLARATVFVAPAKYEPFGLGPLEAALAGCALVLGDIPSLREVWADAALYVDPADRAALAQTLRQLCEQPEQVEALASSARERAHRYSPQVTAAAYADLYRRLPVRTLSA